eukprot:668585-Pyramimonas_sp.AAC.1
MAPLANYRWLRLEGSLVDLVTETCWGCVVRVCNGCTGAVVWVCDGCIGLWYGCAMGVLGL